MGPLGSNCTLGMRRGARPFEVTLRRAVPVSTTAARATEAYQSQVRRRLKRAAHGRLGKRGLGQERVVDGRVLA